MKNLRLTYVIVLFVVALFIFLTLITSIAQASLTTIVVNSTEQEIAPFVSDGDCSLSEAIASAVADTAIDNCVATTGSFGTGGPFVIELDTGTIYILTAIDHVGFGSNGLPTFTGYTRHITINGNGSIIERSTVVSTPDFRIINVYNIGSLTLNNLVIRNGQELAEGGGGISKVGAGTVTLNDCTISGNTALYGGGMFNGNGQLTLNNSVISGNNATKTGGGVMIEMSSDSILNGTTFNNNTAGIEGGGIYHLYSISTLVNSTVSSNTTDMYGGGISNRAGDFNLSNVTVSGNSANEDGAGVYVVNIDTFTGTVSLTNTTITNNTADNNSSGSGDGGGIFKAFTTTVRLKNTILAGNTDRGGEDSDCSNMLTSLGHNLFGDNVDCPSISSDLDLISLGLGIGNVLESLNNNGGSTQTHALVSGSPGINAGDNGACPINDQRGITRSQGVSCDIGAYELLLPSVSLSKTLQLGNNNPIQPGDLLTYTITVVNNGDGNAIGVTISDTLPMYIDGSDVSETVNISAGTSLTITLNVTLSNSVPFGEMITNTAFFSHTFGGGQDSSAFAVAEGTRIYQPIIVKN